MVNLGEVSSASRLAPVPWRLHPLTGCRKRKTWQPGSVGLGQGLEIAIQGQINVLIVHTAVNFHVYFSSYPKTMTTDHLPVGMLGVLKNFDYL